MALPCYAYRAPNCKLHHVVKKGEVLGSIAQKHNTTVSKLKNLNRITNKNHIMAGQSICVNNDVEDCANYHIVKKGDTLSKLAISLGMEPPYESALKIASRNDVTNANRIEIGDKICIKEQPKKQEAVEEPTPAPAPIAEEPKKDEEKDHFGFFATPFMSFGKLDFVDRTTGARGSVVSKTNFGLELKFMQFLTESFSSEFIAIIEQRSYKTASSRTFNDHGGQMTNFGVGIGYNATERLELKARALYGTEFYFRAPSATSLAIDSTRALKMDIIANYDLFRSRSKKYIAGLGLGLRLITDEDFITSDNVSYNGELGYGYFGSFYVRQKFTHIMFEESFIYEDLRKDTDLFKQTMTNMFLRVGVLFLF